MKPVRILVIEDEPLIGHLVADNLRQEGYEAELVPDGGQGLDRCREGDFDLLVLDLMLPTLPGFEVLKRIREQDKQLPILILSARTHERDRIQGLALGADDYLGKPFHLQELLLRVKALLRRAKGIEEEESAPELPKEILISGRSLDFERYEVRRDDAPPVALTRREVELLQLLLERQGRVVSRNEIMDRLWGEDGVPNPRTIDNFIAHFRKLFEDDPKSPRHFHTLRGVGYRFEP
jgi:two-component system, OmpR family, alkaline phosphatase synthesis response regulator PhoP